MTRVYDATSSLTYTLINDLTPERSRALITPEVVDLLLHIEGERSEKKRKSGHNAGHISLYHEAIHLAVTNDPPAEFLNTLIPLALIGYYLDVSGKPDIRSINNALEQRGEGRRAIFLAGISADPKVEGKKAVYWKTALNGNDIEWLDNYVDQRHEELPWLNEYLLRRLYLKGVSQALRNRIRKKLRSRDNDLVDRFDKSLKLERVRVKRYQDSDKQRQKNRDAQKLELEGLVRGRLKDMKRGNGDLMRELSSLCFADENSRYWNVLGEWTDLPEELQHEVISAIRHDLDNGIPKEIPDGSTFYKGTISEADAFQYMIVNVSDFQITNLLVERWLPSVLRASHPINKQVLEECIRASRSATEGAIFGEVSRRFRSQESAAYTLEEIPKELWSESMTAQTVELIKRESVAYEERNSLLRMLARQDPSAALPLAQEIQKTRGKTDAAKSLRTTAIDVLLYLKPTEGTVKLKNAVQQHEAVNVSDLKTLVRYHMDQWHVDLSKCTPEVLSTLYEAVRTIQPPNKDPVLKDDGRAYRVTPAHELGQTRNAVLSALLDRDHDASIVLDRLADQYEEVKGRCEHHRAKQAAEGILATSDISSRPTVDQIVKMLEDGRYRLVRDDHDLHQILLDELAVIKSRVGHHVSMLHEKPVGKKRKKEGKKQEHLHEDALQSYIACRLEDRLTSQRLDGGCEVFCNREPQASRNQRNDIKVQANTVGRGQATVIIEIKWSDNKGARKALSTQLGTRYLKDENLRMGIFLVGWDKNKDKKSIEDWEVMLRTQSEKFTKVNRDIIIEPVLLDLTYRHETTS